MTNNFHTYEVTVALGSGHYLHVLMSETSKEAAIAAVHKTLTDNGARDKDGLGITAFFYPEDTTAKYVEVHEGKEPTPLPRDLGKAEDYFMDYPFVRSWHYMTGSSSWYVTEQLDKARKLKAPWDATYERDGVFHTLSMTPSDSAVHDCVAHAARYKKEA